MNLDVLVVGSVAVDLVYRLAELPHPGSSMISHSRGTFPGGKGANQAVASARFGARTAFAGAVGDDPFADLLTSSLRDSGVDVTGLLIKSGENSGLACIALDAEGQNQIMIDLGANDTYSQENLTESLDDNWLPSVVCSVLEIPNETVQAAFVWAHERGARTVLNAAPPRAVDAHLFSHVDILVVNEHECAFYTGLLPENETQASLAVAALQELGPQSVVLTMGDKGAVIRQADQQVRIEAPQVNAVDTVGAGDCFVGTLCAMLAEGMDLVDAAQLAVRAASLSVTRPGAQPSMPFRNQVSML